MRSLVFALVAWVSAVTTAALDPIEVSGNKFFNKDGSQFFMKGIAYQLTAEEPDDPLIDPEQCQRDADLMKELGVNSLRVYHVDTDPDHDACMKIFADAGIYLLIDLDDFDTYICAADECLGNTHWNQTQFDLYAKVMDTFHVYDNVLGFFIGNERITKAEDSLSAPYYKAAARDMKAYRDAKGYRKIPIGYSAAHIVELQPMLQNYLTCGGNSSEIVDFYGVNSYSWCKKEDNMVTSAYDKLQKYAEDFPVPIFFTETGCNTDPPRLFGDQDAIFGDPMVDTWSGSIIYEWIQEANNYGLISYGPPVSGAPNDETVHGGFTRKGTPTPISPDFDNLKTKWASITPTGVSKKDYDPKTVVTPECPSSTAGGWWQVDGNVKVPALGEEMTGTYTKIPSATADPSDSGNSNSGNGGQDGDDADNDTDDDSAASSDKHITLIGSVIAATVLTVALVL